MFWLKRNKWVQGLAVFFLLSSFLPGFGEELKKLPSLVNHYQHHLEEHEPISFIAFLKLHYDSDSAHNTDEEHEDLPLFQFTAHTVVATTQDLPTLNLDVPLVRSLPAPLHKQSDYFYLHAADLLQPPKRVA